MSAVAGAPAVAVGEMGEEPVAVEREAERAMVATGEGQRRKGKTRKAQPRGKQGRKQPGKEKERQEILGEHPAEGIQVGGLPGATFVVAAAAQRWACPFEGCSFVGLDWPAVRSHHWRRHQLPLDAPRRVDLFAQNEPVKAEWDAECAKTSLRTRHAVPHTPILVGEEQIERVPTFCYLGSTMDESGGVDPEVASRIKKAGASFALLKSRVWTRKDLSQKLKGRVFQAVVMSSLCYGAETWPVCGRSLRRLNTFYHRCLRSMTHLSRLTCTPDHEVREVAGVPSMEEVLRRKRLRWFGHVRRMDRARWPSKMLHGVMAGHTKRGGHPHMWDRVLHDDLDRMDCDDPWNLCLDRKAWKTNCSHKLTRGQM